MEAFSLLKYWRGGGGGGGGSGGGGGGTGLLSSSSDTTEGTTILTAVAKTDTDDDDGPFFDLEFTVPDEVDDSENPKASGSEEEEEEEEEEDDNIEECEREFKFTLSPSSNDRSDPNLSLSPSDDLLVQVDPSSFEPNNKPQFTASLMKSATKFRVFMSALKKSKSNTASDGSDSVAPESQKKQQERKLFTVKFKVEEVPIVSLFTRDNSSRGNNTKPQSEKQNAEDSPSSSSKEVMHKYLKMVKPLYVRVSRRYGDKLNLSSGGKAAPPPPPPATAEKKGAPADVGGGGGESAGSNNSKSQKQGNLPAGLRVVCKHLGKSRSGSSAAVAAAPPPALLSSKRRDDSLLQQQDGIQGAILHCKRSFNASRECETPSELSRKSTNEDKDKRL